MDVFPVWEKLQFGDTLELVVRILLVDDGQILCQTVHRPHHPLVITGDIPSKTGFSDVMLLQGAKVVEVGKIVKCELGLQSCLLPMPVCTRDRLSHVVELCCGMGVFSSVCGEVGLTTLVGIDHNDRWQELFASLHGNASFFAGDCADPHVISKLYHLGACWSKLSAT